MRLFDAQIFLRKIIRCQTMLLYLASSQHKGMYQKSHFENFCPDVLYPLSTRFEWKFGLDKPVPIGCVDESGFSAKFDQ